MSTIPVIQLVSDWSMQIDLNSTTGTRTYIDASIRPDLDPVYLPDIYSAWDKEHPYLVATSIKIGYLTDDINCGKKYIVNYTTNQFTLDYEEITPITLEQGAEFFTYTDDKPNPSKGAKPFWCFDTPDGLVRANMISIPILDITTTIVVHRKFSDSSLDDFIKLSTETVGKLNDNTFHKLPKYYVMYMGASVSQSTNPQGTRHWYAQLRFSVKNITSVKPEDNKGWNMVINTNVSPPVYQTIVWGDEKTKMIYETANFNSLISFGTSISDNVNFPPISN